jgi:hypothetical protein
MDYAFEGLMDGRTDTGVPAAAELIALAEAALAGEADQLGRARTAVVKRLGSDAMIDAAAVIAGFDGITRIADATGIPLEPPRAAETVDLRARLAIDRFMLAKW